MEQEQALAEFDNVKNFQATVVFDVPASSNSRICCSETIWTVQQNMTLNSGRLESHSSTVRVRFETFVIRLQCFDDSWYLGDAHFCREYTWKIRNCLAQGIRSVSWSILFHFGVRSRNTARKGRRGERADLWTWSLPSLKHFARCLGANCNHMGPCFCPSEYYIIFTGNSSQVLTFKSRPRLR